MLSFDLFKTLLFIYCFCSREQARRAPKREVQTKWRRHKAQRTVHHRFQVGRPARVRHGYAAKEAANRTRATVLDAVRESTATTQSANDRRI